VHLAAALADDTHDLVRVRVRGRVGVRVRVRVGVGGRVRVGVGGRLRGS